MGPSLRCVCHICNSANLKGVQFGSEQATVEVARGTALGSVATTEDSEATSMLNFQGTFCHPDREQKKNIVLRFFLQTLVSLVESTHFSCEKLPSSRLISRNVIIVLS